MASEDAATSAANTQAADADTATAASTTANTTNTAVVVAEDCWETDSALGSDAYATNSYIHDSVLRHAKASNPSSLAILLFTN
jgi:hypothetical protein